MPGVSSGPSPGGDGAGAAWPRLVDRRWLRIGLVGVLTVVPLVWLVALRLPWAADGTFSPPSAWTDTGVVVTDVNGQPGDLRPGDKVVGVNGIPLETWLASPPGAFTVGQLVAYRVLRPGTPGPVEVPVTLVSYPFGAVLLANRAAIPILLLLLVVAGRVARCRCLRWRCAGRRLSRAGRGRCRRRSVW